MNVFTLTKDSKGEVWLNAYQGKNHIGKLAVRTGLPGRQNFRTKPKEVKGQYEPVPEAEYNLSQLYWAGGKGNYTTVYPAVKSPIWITIDGVRSIGFHLDAGVIGTAGCVRFKTMADLKTFVNWWNGYGAFQKLYVDWGLGYVKMPDLEKSKPKPSGSVIKVVRHDKEVFVLRNNGHASFSADDLRGLGLKVWHDEPVDTIRIE